MINIRENYFAVEVPDGATGFGFINDSLVCKLPDSKPGCYHWLHEADEQMTEIGGEWEIVCTSKEATEDKLQDLIPEMKAGGRYENYNGDYPVWYHSRKWSFCSLLASKGCDVNKTYLILKKQ